MSFGRHRKIAEQDEKLFQQKIIQDTKDFAADLQKDIDANGGKIPGQTIEPVTAAVIETPAIQKYELKDVEKEVIQKVERNPRKKREDKKVHIGLGIIGNTPEATDFRAICKKKQLQINNVLTTILSEWNKANYTF